MAYTFNPFTGTFDNAPSTLNGDSAFSTLCAISADLVHYDYLHDGFLPLSGGTITGNLSVVGDISATQNYFSGSNKSVFTPQTNTIGVSAISNIVAVSALPATPDPSTLYIII
jgi:hypothetical protein